ncbi:MAG: type secretion system-associated protein TagF [Pseudomonadota bacterium]|jgi:type VI secretion system protein ImpM
MVWGEAMAARAATDGAAPGVCGWFGKLPALGDFGSRRLPREMVARCDAWLSAGMAASQRELGGGWLDLYLTAPVWRFAWAPGVAGPDWWLGVLMPSVDRVGRYFPLLIAATCPAGHAAQLDPASVDPWLDRLAGIAQASLGAGARLDDLEAALASAPLPGVRRDRVPMPVRSLGASGRVRHTLAPGTGLAAAMGALAQSGWLAGLDGQTLWWTGLDTHAADPSGWPACLSVGPGLPAPDAFAELLRGAW